MVTSFNVDIYVIKNVSNKTVKLQASIFIEPSRNGSTTVVGEIYRTPNSNVTLSTQRYESVINKL